MPGGRIGTGSTKGNGVLQAPSYLPKQGTLRPPPQGRELLNTQVEASKIGGPQNTPNLAESPYKELQKRTPNSWKPQVGWLEAAFSLSTAPAAPFSELHDSHEEYAGTYHTWRVRRTKELG